MNRICTQIATDCSDGVLTVRIDRPEKKNALTAAMYAALADALCEADENPAVRVVLLTGSGGSFTSGNDLADFVQSPPSGEESPVFRFLTAISRARKPLVAAVEGVAVGVGVTMLLHCDLVCAAADTLFQMPFVSLGLCPEAGSTLLLPRMAGHQRAAELLLLGEPFSAERAREVGIVNVVCSGEKLAETALAKARRLAAQPPAAIRLAKSLLKREYAAALTETIAEEGRCFAGMLRSPEAAEAFRAFLEKRTPDFSRFT